MGWSNKMDEWVGSERVRENCTAGRIQNSNFNISFNWINTVFKKTNQFKLRVHNFFLIIKDKQIKFKEYLIK